jgi:hypothetical protein
MIMIVGIEKRGLNMPDAATIPNNGLYSFTASRKTWYIRANPSIYVDAVATALGLTVVASIPAGEFLHSFADLEAMGLAVKISCGYGSLIKKRTIFHAPATAHASNLVGVESKIGKIKSACIKTHATFV